MINTNQQTTQQTKKKSVLRLASLFCLTTLILSPLTYAASNQALDTLKTHVENFIVEHTASIDGKIDFSVTHPDHRLRLSDCTESLSVFLPPGSRLEGNTTLGVKCTNPAKYWTVYVAARINIYKPVVVAKRPIERGKVIEISDLTTQVQEISTLRASYFMNPKHVSGKVASRRIGVGSPLTSNAVKTPPLVKRGQQVTILALINSLEIRMTGKALANGKAGDVIKVRNANSNRVIEGKVIQTGVVQVRI